MSNQAITWAYQQMGLKQGAKFLLVTLANYADERSECFPGVNTLAADCGMGRSTVIRNVKQLEEDGKLEILHRGGDGSGRKSNVYRLACSPEFSGNVSNRDLGSNISNRDGLSPESGRAKSQNETKGNISNRDGLSLNLEGAKSQNGTLTITEPSDEPPESTAEEVSDTQKHPPAWQELKTELAALNFTHEQVHTAKVVGLVKAWAKAGLAKDDLRQVVTTLRERNPEKPFSPAYLEGPIADYLEAKKNGNAASGRIVRQSGGSRQAGHDIANEILEEDLSANIPGYSSVVYESDAEDVSGEVHVEVGGS